MAYAHVDDGETVRNNANRGAPAQQFNDKPFYIIHQFSLCVKDVSCTILKYMTKPAVVRSTKLELRPRDLGSEAECPIDDVKCGFEIGVSIGPTVSQWLPRVINECHLIEECCADIIDTMALDVNSRQQGESRSPRMDWTWITEASGPETIGIPS